MNTHDEDNEMILQPKNLQIKLFNHQLTAIKFLEKREASNLLPVNNIFSQGNIKTNVGIFADITGYGKTASIIGLLMRDKMSWDLKTDYLHSSISANYGNGRIIKINKEYYSRFNCNLIITNQSIIGQWKSELSNFTDLKFTCIVNKKKCDNIDPEKFDILLCSPTMFNRLVSKFPNHAWKRLIFDEPTTTKIPSMKSIMAGFYWFVTATPYMLTSMGRINRTNFLNSLFCNYMPMETFEKLIVKNDDDYVLNSFSLPQTSHIYHKCKQPLYQLINGLISDNVLEMVSAGNIEGVIRALGGNKTDNVLELVKGKKKEELDEINHKIQRYEKRKDEDRVKIWKDKQTQTLSQLTLLENRFKNILEDPCNICLDNLDKPALVPCCQNIFCGKCILQWLKNKNTCPLCRDRNLNTSKITYIETKTNKNKSKKTKYYKN